MKNNTPNRNLLKYFQTGLLSVVFFIVCILCTTTSTAQGDLMLFPKRIIFDGSKKTQEINIANSGKDTARYILSVVQIRMKEDGSFEKYHRA